MRGRSREKMIATKEKEHDVRLRTSSFRETSGAAGYRFSRVRNLQPWHMRPRRFSESDSDDGRRRGLATQTRFARNLT